VTTFGVNPFPVGTEEWAEWELAEQRGAQGPDEPTSPADRLRGIDAGQEPVGGQLDSWAPVDLGPYLRGEVQRPEPTVGLARDDMLRLIYPGKEHVVFGEMECGKSWLCVACAAAELLAGNHVLYVHFEDDPADTVDRMVMLDVPADVILRRFHFVAPERKVGGEALDKLLTFRPSLVILDGVNEGMSLHGWAIREEDGAALFRRHLVRPFIRAGAAVLSADHVVKDRQARDRYALGSIHKGNALTGSAILLENADPFGRGLRGRSHVYVTKDRPGFLRRNGKAGKIPGKTYLGEMVVDDTRLWVPFLELTWFAGKDRAGDLDEADPVDQHAEDDDYVLGLVRELTEATGAPVTQRGVRAKSKLGTDKTVDALERLVFGKRLVRMTGPRGAHLFSVPDGLDHAPTGTGPPSEGPVTRTSQRTSGPGDPRTTPDHSGPVELDGPTDVPDDSTSGRCALCGRPTKDGVCDARDWKHFEEEDQ